MMHRTALLFALVVGLVGGCATTGSKQKSSAPKQKDELTEENDQTKASDSDASTAKSSSETDSASASSGPPDGFSEAAVMNVYSTPGGSAVVLEEGSGGKVVPIFIGRSQAMAIKLRLERRRYTRPLTHDLLDNVIAELDGEVTKVHIDAVKSGVFVGTVFIEGPKTTMEFDARSSDAIAIAVGNQVPIYVADSVFERAGVPAEKFERRDLGKPKDSLPSPEREKQPPKKEKEGEGKGPYF